MKTRLLIYLSSVFTLLYISSQAQENTYFDHNPEWNINGSCSFGGFCIRNEVFNYYIKGDSLIDSLRYVQVFKKSQGSFTWNAPGPNFGCTGNFVLFDSVAKCFLRSYDKQVFIRMPGDSLEQLLYDYNLEIGDTLPITYNNYTSNITVSAKDSIFTAYGYRARFTLAGSTWAQYLIEGMGHSRGLIEPLSADPNCTFILNCYGYNDTSYFPSIGGTCDAAIGIRTYEEKKTVSVFPNPLNLSSTFSFDASLKNVQLKLYSVFGQELAINKSATPGKIVLNRERLNAGIYFYELLFDDGTKNVGKLTVEDN